MPGYPTFDKDGEGRAGAGAPWAPCGTLRSSASNDDDDDANGGHFHDDDDDDDDRDADDDDDDKAARRARLPSPLPADCAADDDDGGGGDDDGGGDGGGAMDCGGEAGGVCSGEAGGRGPTLWPTSTDDASLSMSRSTRSDGTWRPTSSVPTLTTASSISGRAMCVDVRVRMRAATPRPTSSCRRTSAKSVWAGRTTRSGCRAVRASCAARFAAISAAELPQITPSPSERRMVSASCRCEEKKGDKEGERERRRRRNPNPNDLGKPKSRRERRARRTASLPPKISSIYRPRGRKRSRQ